MSIVIITNVHVLPNDDLIITLKLHLYDIFQLENNMNIFRINLYNIHTSREILKDLSTIALLFKSDSTFLYIRYLA